MMMILFGLGLIALLFLLSPVIVDLWMDVIIKWEEFKIRTKRKP